MVRVFLGLGSNKSFDSKSCVEILRAAVDEIREFVDSLECSSVYKTGAMYVEDQDDFYNMVVTGLYAGTPFELLKKINQVEAQFGRDRSQEIRNGCRSLDIDIEIFGNEVIDTANLVVPHQRLKERAFVLVPMLEIFNESADELSVGLSDIQHYLSSDGVQGQKIELFMRKEIFSGLKKRGTFNDTNS